jgi:hypothetical protein
VLEVCRVGKKYAIEERTCIKVCREGRVVAADGILEIGDIRCDDQRVQREHVVAKHQLVFTGVALEGVHRLGERRSCPRLVYLGPEETDQLVAGNPARAGGRQHGQNGEAPPLRRCTGEWPVLAFQGKTAKRLETQHLVGSWSAGQRR